MRWAKVEPISPRLNEIRTRVRFAFLPTTVGDFRVWLERYIVEEQYQEIDTGGPAEFRQVYHKWVEIDRRVGSI